MRYFAYITDQCRDMAAEHALSSEVKKLAGKVESDQSISAWDNFPPEPIVRKVLGRSFRLIAVKTLVEDDIILCFLGVWARGSADYDRFLSSPRQFVERFTPQEEVVKEYVRERLKTNLPLPEMLPPDNREYGYLYNTGLEEVDHTYGIIFESHDWVEMIKTEKYSGRMSRFFDLLCQKVINAAHNQDVAAQEHGGAKIVFKRFPRENHVFLIAPFLNEGEGEEKYIRKKYADVLNMPDGTASSEKLLKYSSRSYPQLILADDEDVWHKVQKNAEGNLALSPEEAEILRQMTRPEDVRERFPLFINGRPGSGKSTILQYLFAEYLFLHLCKRQDERMAQPPVYLTYSEMLLRAAKQAVYTIIRCNSKFIAYKHLDLDKPEVNRIVDQGFGEFHKFILQFLPTNLKSEVFRDDRFYRFSDFRKEWIRYRKNNPEVKIRKMSPELAWHVIRSYIKGMSDQSDNYFGIESYEELSREQQSVTVDNYEFIFERVWENWYKPLCEKHGYWDNQDLTAAVLEYADKDDLSRYPGIFCDEAQDFTRNELELILNLSVFPRRKIATHELTRVPFAFAGDPFQTLNPTGFSWNSVRAGFHEKLVRHLDKTASGRLSMNYKELSYNYRSSKHIVGLTNLIQLTRGLLFDIRDLKPQKAWFEERYLQGRAHNGESLNADRLPQYYNVSSDACRRLLSERSDIIIIIPCQEGEEEVYVEQDEFLSTLTGDNHFIRNFLSPMQAKGLEFHSVVLYKFGEDLVTSYADLLSPLKNGTPHQGEAALPFEYFMNRLYVAASRAKNNLFIVDTEQGIEAIWRNRDLLNFDELLASYNRTTENQWKLEDLTLVEPGQDLSLDLSEQGDSPFDIAQSFKHMGMLESSAYLLRLAAANYRRSNYENEASKCEALAYEYEDKLEKAGLVYVSLNMRDEALRCLWRASALANIASNNLFANTIYQKAAIFEQQSADEEASFVQCREILDEIKGALGVDSSMFVNEHRTQWSKIIDKLITTLLRSRNAGKEVHDTSSWQAIYQDVAELTMVGLIPDGTPNLARLAFYATNYQHAVDIWEECSQNNHRDYYFSLAKVTGHPGNIELFFKSDALAEIVAIAKKDDIAGLTGERIRRLVGYCLSHDKVKDALAILKINPEYTSIRELYQKARELCDTRLQGDILGLLIEVAVKENKWDDLISHYERQEATGELAEYANGLLVHELAYSQDFASAQRKKRERLGKYLRKLLIESPWCSLAKIRVAGTAIEKAHKIIDALEFYELIWSSKKIPATPNEITFAKKRWLKRKYLLGDLTNSPKHSKEADKLNDEWGLHIDINKLPTYPVIKPGKKGSMKTDNKTRAILTLHQGNMEASDIAEVLNIEPAEVLQILAREESATKSSE